VAIPPETIVFPGVRTDSVLLGDLLGPDGSEIKANVSSPNEKRPLVVTLNDGSRITGRTKPGVTIKKVRESIAKKLQGEIDEFSIYQDDELLPDDVLIAALDLVASPLTASRSA
jgi:hypothetical protein